VTRELLERIVVPVANEADAEVTCSTLIPYMRDRESEIVVLHVIEKAGGYIDKAPLEARQEQAVRTFDLVRREFVTSDLDLETELRYGTDVTETILDAAEDLGASAVVLTPRAGDGPRERLSAYLSGDVGYNLLKNDRLPVVVLPASPGTNEGSS